MDLAHTIILALLEGITEFLPISSTAHLVLASKLLNITSTEFSKSFDIIIQSGAILAVVALYAKRLLKDFETSKRVVIAFIPTGTIGLLTYKIVKTYLLDNIFLVLWSLVLGGIAIIILEYFFKEKTARKTIKDLSYFQAAVVGIVQCLSFIPGVSRAAATIFSGMFMGLSRREAVELSFMLSIPTMLAATSYDLVKNYSEFNNSQFFTLSLGFIFAFIAAFISIKWLLKFVSSHSFVSFGVYRILLGGALLLLWSI